MANVGKNQPSMQQSMADLVLAIRSLTSKVVPHLGFIYLSLMLLGITTVVYLVGQAMQSSEIGQASITKEKEAEYTSLFVFDPTTLKQIKTLGNENSSAAMTLPSGRINPFSESVY